MFDSDYDQNGRLTQLKVEGKGRVHLEQLDDKEWYLFLSDGKIEKTFRISVTNGSVLQINEDS